MANINSVICKGTRQASKIKPVATIFDPQPVKPAVQTGNFKLPLHMPFVHVIAERQTREPLNPRENAAQIAQVYEPISEDDAKAPEATSADQLPGPGAQSPPAAGAQALFIQ